MRKAIFPVSWMIQARLAQLATVVDENIQGVRIVKAFAAEGRQLRSLAESADRIRWAYRQDARIRSRWNPLLDNLPRLGLALVLLVGGLMVINGHTTVGTIVAFNSYVLMLQPPFRMLGMMIMMGQRASASARRIYEILDTPSDIVDDPAAVDVPLRGDLAFEDVSFAYPNGTVALEGLNLTLRAGETVAVVGGTGSGKSTLGRLAARFYDVTSGSVTIDGVDVRRIRLADLAEVVGIVSQETYLLHTTVRENLRYARPDATDAELERAARAARIHDLIASLPDGYDTVVGSRGHRFSGGEKQRIAIARTLLRNPRILVLDEATSALDTETERAVQDAFDTLAAGRTTITIAHRLSTVRNADQIAVIDHGRIIESGTHQSLLARDGRYAALAA